MLKVDSFVKICWWPGVGQADLGKSQVRRSTLKLSQTTNVRLQSVGWKSLKKNVI